MVTKRQRTLLMAKYSINDLSKGVFANGLLEGLLLAESYNIDSVSRKELVVKVEEISKLRNEIAVLKKQSSVRYIKSLKSRYRTTIKRLNNAIDFWKNKAQNQSGEINIMTKKNQRIGETQEGKKNKRTIRI